MGGEGVGRETERTGYLFSAVKRVMLCVNSAIAQNKNRGDLTLSGHADTGKVIQRSWFNVP